MRSTFNRGAAALLSTGRPRFRRATLPLTPETLAETARLWPAGRVRAWFGRDQRRLFFSVPQVAVYQDGGIPVCLDWLEPPVRSNA